MVHPSLRPFAGRVINAIQKRSSSSVLFPSRNSPAILCVIQSNTTTKTTTTHRSFSRTSAQYDSKKDQEEGWGKLQGINVEDMTYEEAKKFYEEAIAEYEIEQERKNEKKWVPGTRKKPLIVSYNMDDLLESDVPKWTLRDKRCGALGIKVGMLPVWDNWGERHACTVVLLDDNVVMEHKTVDTHGYNSVVLGAGERKLKRVTKPLLKHYEKLGIENPPAIVREFRVGGLDGNTDNVLPPLGSKIHASHFVPGQNVDVAGISKGKGFQGAMKRHNFKGMPASHGVSKSHRALGSTGQCQDPGRVFKGKKMAGRMGHERVTVQNLRVVKIDRGRNLIYLKGVSIIAVVCIFICILSFIFLANLFFVCGYCKPCRLYQVKKENLSKLEML